MVDLPKELFEIGNPGEIRKYHFTNFNGFTDEIELEFGDKLIDKRCPLDGAYIVAYSGDPHTVLECPLCKQYVPQFSQDTEEQVARYIKNNFIPNTERELRTLENQVNYLEGILLLAKNPDNDIKKTTIGRNRISE